MQAVIAFFITLSSRCHRGDHQHHVLHFEARFDATRIGPFPFRVSPPLRPSSLPPD